MTDYNSDEKLLSESVKNSAIFYSQKRLKVTEYSVLVKNRYQILMQWPKNLQVGNFKMR